MSQEAMVGTVGIIIPWFVFVTLSLFNQRQEIALIKQEIRTLKEILEHLRKTKPLSK